MLNLFGKNAFARKRKAKVMQVDSGSRIETLEERLVLAVNVAYNAANGNLTLTGSGAVDDVTVTITGTNSVVLTTTGSFTGSTVVSPSPAFIVTGDLRIDMGNGGDTVNLVGGVGTGTLDSGNVYVDLGSNDAGTDTLNVAGGASTALIFTGNVSVDGGTGTDSINFGATAAVTTANLTIDTGTESDSTLVVAETVLLDQLTANGNVSIANHDRGLQQAQIGSTNAAANQINGNLIITQAYTTVTAAPGLANTGGYTASLRNTSVTGTAYISNGIGTQIAGTSAALTTITTTVASAITGSTTVINGNNATNTANIVGGAGLATFSGNVSLTNGNSTAAGGNQINVDGAIIGTNAVNNRTTAAFTNGSGLNNDINMSVTNTNTSNAAVFASNNNAGGGAATANDVTITRGTFNRNVQISNGLNSTVDAVTNTVTLAGAAQMSVAGNLVISNANTVGAGANAVTIGAAAGVATTGLLTTGTATGTGNLSISNGSTTTGVASVLIQGAAGGATAAASTNAVGGNLSIFNRGGTAAAVTKTVNLSGLVTFGRTGATINNAGGGNSTTNIGIVAAASPVFITGTGGLLVQDGSGIATLDIRNATIGTLGTANQAGFRYSDMGGGVDNIDLSFAAGSFVANGVTRIDTAGGSDIIRIGVAASATFNDSVFIDLGAGVDSLTIGANAASPAFGTASKFQFNGGNGDDTISASATSVAGFANPVPKKLKSKVTSFEHVTATA